MITGNAQDIAAVMAATNELSLLIGQLKGENEYLKRRVAELERVTAGRGVAAPVVALSDEQIDRIAGCNGLYRAMTPDDTTCKSTVRRYTADILAAAGQEVGE